MPRGQYRRKCLYCGTMFLPIDSSRFCSPSCSYEHSHDDGPALSWPYCEPDYGDGSGPADTDTWHRDYD
jgi:hypothetical protein